jgi:hypothetical protein
MLGILDKVKGAANTIASSTIDACGAGLDSARKTLDEISAASADLEALGYTVRDIEVSVSVPPAVTVFLTRTGEPTEEAFTAALANRSGQSTAWLLIKLTQQADRWSNSLRMGGRRCREIAIDLGIRPAVRLMFGKDRS